MTHHGINQNGRRKKVCAILASTCIGALALSAFAGSEEVKRENGVFYIEVEGTPYDMGRQHGTMLAKEVRTAIADYKKNVEKTFGKENAQKICDWAMKEASFTADVKKYSPHCYEEVQGIASGAGVSVDDVLMLQMYEEVYEAGPGKAGLKVEETFGAGCTAFQATVGDRRFSGQNMDYSGNLQEQQLVTRYKYPNKEILLYTFVGQVGGIGVNSNGLSAFVTTLPQGDKREAGGLGCQYVLRAMLEEDSVDKAIARLKELPRFSTMSYSLSDAKRSVVVEASPDEVKVRETSESQPFLVACNHITMLKERNDIPGFYEGGEPVQGMPFLTAERCDKAHRFLHKHHDRLSVKDLERMLTKAPINMVKPTFMTLQSAIAACEGDKCKLFVSAGHDPKRDWNKYAF